LLFLALANCVPLLVQAGGKQASAAPNPLHFKRLDRSQNIQQFYQPNCLAQDSLGFIWIGTAYGLLRYDGRNSTLYISDENNQGSISSNYIRAIAFDQQNIMWVATEFGLNTYNPRTDTFTRWMHDESNANSISTNFVKTVFVGSDNRVYVGTGKGLDIIENDRITIKHYTQSPGNPQSLSHNYVRAIFEDAEGKLWIGTEGGGLNRFDPKTELFTRFQHRDQDSNSLAGNYVSTITEDQFKRLWIGTLGSGLSRLDQSRTQFTNYQVNADSTNLHDNVIYQIEEDSRGAIWILTDRAGAVIYEEGSNSFRSLQHNPFDSSTLATNTVKAFLEDSQSNIWLGTFPSGLNFFSRRASQFEYFYHIENNPNTLSSSAILDVIKDRNGLLWVGTERGLNAMDDSGNIVKQLRKGDAPHGLSAHAALALEEDIDGSLWIGTWSGGLNHYSPKTGLVTQYKTESNDPGSVFSPFIWKVYLDSQQQLWLATETNGLNRYNRQTDTFSAFAHDPSDDNSLSYDYVWDILEDSQHRLWVATQYGLNQFLRASKTFTRYLPDAKKPDSLNTGRLHALLEDSAGHLWIATQGGGINHFNPSTGKFSSLRVSDGLTNDSVAALLQDNEGFIWGATASGLVKVDPETFTVVASYSQANGLINHSFMRNAAFKDDDGTLYFGSAGGLLRFKPSLVTDDRTLPKPIITDVQIFNESLRKSKRDFSTSAKDGQITRVALKHDDAMISFVFTTINFQQSRNNRFSYKLENFDRSWNTVNDIARATYTNLDPGRYRFRIATVDERGRRSANTNQVLVFIEAPPWRTWWAYTLYVMITIALVFGLVRIYSLRITTQQLNELVAQRTNELVMANRAKTEFLANMSHELRTPLNAIIGFSKRLIKKSSASDNPQYVKALDSIYRNGLHLLSIINDILDITKIEAGKLEINAITCNVRVAIEETASDMRPKIEEKKLHLSLPTDYPVSKIEADPVRLSQILNNLLSNAVKYTHQGSITITVSKRSKSTQHFCAIAVTDTGVGIKKDDQKRLFTRFEQFDEAARKQRGHGTGLGLSLVKTLCESHGGWIECESTFGEGSCFTAVLPVRFTPLSTVKDEELVV